MNNYIGDFAVGATLNFKFPTQALTGAPITLAGTPAVKVYKDNATDTEVTTGVTLSVDFDGITGLHNVNVVMTDAFYAAAHDYTAVITTGTVDGLSVVGKPVATWSIENRQTSPILDAVGNISISGSPTYAGPTSYTLTTGTQTSGTYANVDSPNGVYHVHTDVGAALSLTYHYTLRSDEEASSLVFKGRVNGSNDSVLIQAYDWVNSAFVTIYSLTGVNTTVDTIRTEPLVGKYTGTGANAGKVNIKIVNNGALSTATLYIDQLIVGKSNTSRSTGYTNGLIYIDTVNGSAGSEVFTNGTADNPVDNYADAELLETALGFARFHVSNGSSLTISGLVNDLIQHAFHGDNWTLVCTNSLDITGAYIEGATISGTTTGDGAVLSKCVISDLTIAEAHFKECHLLGNITLVASKDYNFVDCVDDDAATTSQPKITFAATNNVGLRRYSGGLEIASFVATDYLTMDGAGRLVIGSTCSANPNGTITIRGPWASVTDNVSGGFKGTLTETQRLSGAESTAGATAEDVWTYATRALTDKANFTLTSAYDAAKTAAQPGADADTLKTLSDQLDIVTGGSGGSGIDVPITVTLNGVAYEGATVEFYLLGVLKRTGDTDINGQLTFNVPAGTYTYEVHIPGEELTSGTYVVSA